MVNFICGGTKGPNVWMGWPPNHLRTDPEAYSSCRPAGRFQYPTAAVCFARVPATSANNNTAQPFSDAASFVRHCHSTFYGHLMCVCSVKAVEPCFLQ